jgi:hypothetical protein
VSVDPDGRALPFIAVVAIGAGIGGLVNGFMHIDRPGGFWKGFAIGAVAGGVGAATGGAAFALAGGAAGGGGGFLAGAIGGVYGAGFSSPIQGFGNAFVFNDPYSFDHYVRDVALGGVFGGVVNGGVAAWNGKSFWNGNMRAPASAPPGTLGTPQVGVQDPANPATTGGSNVSEEISAGFTYEGVVDDATGQLHKTSIGNLKPGEVQYSGQIMQGGANVGDDIAIQFGKGQNQVYHAFRHTDALGLDRSLVQSTIQNHFKTVSAQIVAGKPFNQIIEIGGQRIQYTAFKLPDGTFNIGRIHGVN